MGSFALLVSVEKDYKGELLVSSENYEDMCAKHDKPGIFDNECNHNNQNSLHKWLELCPHG